jgi:hypothetical protein
MLKLFKKKEVKKEKVTKDKGGFVQDTMEWRIRAILNEYKKQFSYTSDINGATFVDKAIEDLNKIVGKE